MDMLQMDVFNTFIELLRQTGNVSKGQIDINEMRQVNLMIVNCQLTFYLLFFFFFCLMNILVPASMGPIGFCP